MSVLSIRSLMAAGGLSIAALISGCATPASSSSMTVRAADATTACQSTPEALKANVAIRDVTGGKETNPMWVSNVGSSEFEKALEDSLRAVGMLSSNRQTGRFQLVAHMAKIDQPLLGFNMTEIGRASCRERVYSSV